MSIYTKYFIDINNSKIMQANIFLTLLEEKKLPLILVKNILSVDKQPEPIQSSIVCENISLESEFKDLILFFICTK